MTKIDSFVPLIVLLALSIFNAEKTIEIEARIKKLEVELKCNKSEQQFDHEVLGKLDQEFWQSHGEINDKFEKIITGKIRPKPFMPVIGDSLGVMLYSDSAGKWIRTTSSSRPPISK